ncbi:gamma-glutamylcyclotransferase family protein [Thiomicrorhabdus heinhorstiae]|uniref:Gamma-glutamylcyclotransferase n=1 Tax=Thiomicrorhabdus heinhorstiae TaxID=2748010 RepID=A0ABS0BUB5_9GAMM|nr:gamma-glutamylcyclotransferase family protein [Thiomicrorhabdus heinhorstiae]MBF6057409.1 gamma-glutamylcyclotransferase [Thiomicrorhabdus heinhorstiae]
MEKNQYLFVYGSLRKRAARHDLIAAYCEYVSEAYLNGKLFEVAGYPGAIESSQPDDRVLGEVYRIVEREKLLAGLDEYEECSENFPLPHEYIRKKLAIDLADGKRIFSWVYIFNRDTSELMPITNGDYLAFLNLQLVDLDE